VLRIGHKHSGLRVRNDRSLTQQQGHQVAALVTPRACVTPHALITTHCRSRLLLMLRRRHVMIWHGKQVRLKQVRLKHLLQVGLKLLVQVGLQRSTAARFLCCIVARLLCTLSKHSHDSFYDSCPTALNGGLHVLHVLHVRSRQHVRSRHSRRRAGG